MCILHIIDPALIGGGTCAHQSERIHSDLAGDCIPPVSALHFENAFYRTSLLGQLALR